jgi:Uma2 family endonuclease
MPVRSVVCCEEYASDEMMAMIKTKMTAAEYFDLPETTQPTQLLDGELIEMPAPELIHQDIVLNIAVLLRQITLVTGGKVYVSPVDVHLNDQNVSQPDVLWTAPDSNCKPEGTKYLAGAPDLIVEVLSPSTARYDRTTKFLLYEKHGVHEYWIVDPHRQYLEVWRLEGAEYLLQGSYGVGERFESAVLKGATILLSAVFG